MRFVRNDIELPDNENDDNDTAAKRSAPTEVLFRNPEIPSCARKSTGASPRRCPHWC